MRILNTLIVPKNVKGGLFEVFNSQFVAKYQKIEKRLFGTLKNFRKKILTKSEKNQKDDPLFSSTVLYVTLKMETVKGVKGKR